MKLKGSASEELMKAIEDAQEILTEEKREEQLTSEFITPVTEIVKPEEKGDS